MEQRREASQQNEAILDRRNIERYNIMDLYEELLGIIDALNDAEIDYAICGGIAVAFYGYPRFTKDIDLLVEKKDLEKIQSTLGERGFILKAGPIPFSAGTAQQREIYRISKIEGKELLTVDLLLVYPILQDVWEEREVFEWRGKHVQVVSLEGLGKMKLLSRRDQDLLDLKKLGIIDEDNK